MASALPQPQSAASKDSDKQPLLEDDQDIETKEDNTETTFTYSETNVTSKHSTYSEKVAIITKETHLHQLPEKIIETTEDDKEVTKDDIGDIADDANDKDDDEDESKPPLPSSDPPSVHENGGQIDLLTGGEIISSQIITSQSRTVETTTFTSQVEEGGTETYTEQKVTIQSDADDIIDHDEALALAIQEATAMNPDMTVEKIEINQCSHPGQD